MAQKVTRISTEKAPAFIAQLVREGVTFESYEDPNDENTIVIEFTGGF